MATLGLIGARAGSKRLPGKNTADVGGKPLVAWTLERAVELLQRGVFDACVVSSDDPEVIRLAALEHGLHWRHRPAELAADNTPDRAWVAEVPSGGYDTICLMRPTSPFLTADTVQAMVERFREWGSDSVVSGTNVGPAAKCWRQKDGAWVSGSPAGGRAHEEPSMGIRTLVQTGGCDVIRASNLPTSLRGDQVDLHEVSWPESCDINEAVDLEMARAWMYRDRVQNVLREV